MTRSLTLTPAHDGVPTSENDAPANVPPALPRNAVSQFIVEETDWREEQTLSGLTAVTIAGAG